MTRTQVGIVGAGPAGLTLAHLLHLEGIDSVVIEDRSREYVEARIRAGVLEQGTADLLVEAGVGERMQREGMSTTGSSSSSTASATGSTFDELIGKSIVIYGQTEIVKDLIEARLDDRAGRCCSSVATSPSPSSTPTGRGCRSRTTARGASWSAT